MLEVIGVHVVTQVPMLAQQILDAGSFRLEGIAVGDGCLGGGAPSSGEVRNSESRV